MRSRRRVSAFLRILSGEKAGGVQRRVRPLGRQSVKFASAAGMAVFWPFEVMLQGRETTTRKT